MGAGIGDPGKRRQASDSSLSFLFLSAMAHSLVTFYTLPPSSECAIIHDLL